MDDIEINFGDYTNYLSFLSWKNSWEIQARFKQTFSQILPFNK